MQKKRVVFVCLLISNLGVTKSLQYTLSAMMKYDAIIGKMSQDNDEGVEHTFECSDRFQSSM